MTELLNDICTGFCQEAALIAAIFIYMITAFILGKNFFKLSKYVALISLIGALVSSLKIQIIPTYYAFNGAYVSNFYTVFFKIIILLCSLLVLITSKNIVFKRRSKVFDYFVTILFTTLGAITLVSANDFLTMFIALELMGISSFLLLLFSKSMESKKSTAIYFITKIISSLTMILGISFIYFASNSLNFDVIYSMLNQGNELSVFFNIGCILCALGLLFYTGIIPFSNWLPNICEKNKNNSPLFLSLVPVLATFGLISRLIVFIFQYTPMVQAMLFIIGILSIYKGVLCLLREENLKRFFGHYIIIQSGFIILGYCIATPYAVSTSVLYTITSIFTTVGLWAIINILNYQYNINTTADLKGLIYSKKIFSFAFMVCLLSAAGLPVTGGFLAKIYLFGTIIKCTNLYLVFLGIVMIASVIGIYAFLKPIIKMFEISDQNNFIATKFCLQKLILYSFTTINILICIFPEKIIQICQLIAYQL